MASQGCFFDPDRARRDPDTTQDQCPRCCILAVTPLVSVHRPGGDIAHHWKCKTCEFDWDTIFRPLLV